VWHLQQCVSCTPVYVLRKSHGLSQDLALVRVGFLFMFIDLRMVWSVL
jgi:hypothetical protein